MSKLRRLAAHVGRQLGRYSLALILVLGGCAAGMVIIDALPETPLIVVYGGNTDPGDGQGGGAARDQLVAGGWATAENVYQVQWKADIGSGTATITDAAMPAGHAAYDEHCGKGNCIIAGFSLGCSPALQLAAEVGQPPDRTYIYGCPQPATGIWHAQVQDNPIAEPWFQQLGNFKTDRAVPAGTLHFFGITDPYANLAPQCQGPGLFAMNLSGHRIISKQEADSSHIWTGPDGVVNHEVGYTGPQGVPASGADASQPWAFCQPGGDWTQTINSPSEAVGGTPGFPGLGGDNGVVPGIPGGSPIPSVEGNMPGVPTDLPQLPGVPAVPLPQLPGVPG